MRILDYLGKKNRRRSNQEKNLTTFRSNDAFGAKSVATESSTGKDQTEENFESWERAPV